jgi:hypothetical protein
LPPASTQTATTPTSSRATTSTSSTKPRAVSTTRTPTRPAPSSSATGASTPAPSPIFSTSTTAAIAITSSTRRTWWIARSLPKPTVLGGVEADTPRLRCPAGRPCPKEGWWITPAKADSRRLFMGGRGHAHVRWRLRRNDLTLGREAVACVFGSLTCFLTAAVSNQEKSTRDSRHWLLDTKSLCR